MPKSCDDLQKIGHRKSGFFTVMGKKTVDNVYCDFTKPINDGGESTIIALLDSFNNFKNFVDQVFKKKLAIST
jgi:hypothetical protein